MKPNETGGGGGGTGIGYRGGGTPPHPARDGMAPQGVGAVEYGILDLTELAEGWLKKLIPSAPGTPPGGGTPPFTIPKPGLIAPPKNILFSVSYRVAV